MSTRSLTIVMDKGLALITMYRHCDGYPSGHGQELADFLNGMKIVNGLSGDQTKLANGMPCLAAQLVAHFKDGPGGIYLHAQGTDDIGEEYVYFVSEKNGAPYLKVYDCPYQKPRKLIWQGQPSIFNGEALESANQEA